jgi:serine protease Do
MEGMMKRFAKIPLVVASVILGSVALQAHSASVYKMPAAGPLSAAIGEDVKVLKSFSKVFVNIAKETRPALVFIETQTKPDENELKEPSPQEDPRKFFEFFFKGGPRPDRSQPRGGGGAGSGFIVDLKEGYVITNNHVAANTSNITVTTFDNRKFKAKVVGADKSVDIAVLKLEKFSPGELKQASLGDSDGAEVGDWVVALGAPYGLPQTLTVGVVSALGRGNLIGGQALEDFIQTDAAINPGNSGGPLLSIDGRVVGINTMISSPTGSSAGIGFAVPSNMAKLVAEMLINDGKVTRGYLGLEGRNVQDMGPEVTKKLGLNESAEGAFVLNVVPSGPADKAGLKPYDVVTNVGSHSISNFQQLRTRVAFTAPGTKVKVQLLRDGKKTSAELVVGTFPTEKEMAASNKKQTGSQETVLEKYGIAVLDLNAQQKKQNGGTKGNVAISGVQEGSLADRAGLQSQDIILELNRKPLRNSSELGKQLKEAEENGRDVLLLIERNGRSQLLVFPLG